MTVDRHSPLSPEERKQIETDMRNVINLLLVLGVAFVLTLIAGVKLLDTADRAVWQIVALVAAMAAELLAMELLGRRVRRAKKRLQDAGLM